MWMSSWRSTRRVGKRKNAMGKRRNAMGKRRNAEDRRKKAVGRHKNAVEMRGISKRFGSVVANDRIDLELRRGEILALLGENGAGKTTLMNILYGLCPCDAGEIFVRGQRVRIRGVPDALALQIGMVHQHFKLIGRLTVAENVVLGTDLSDRFWFNGREAVRRTAKLARRHSFEIDPSARVQDLSVGVRQRVEILKALHRGAEVLILDEPTSVLTPQEAENLFEALRTFKRDGKAVVFITHKLSEVMAISDRVCVLSAGRLIGNVATAQTNADQLARMMVPRSADSSSHVNGKRRSKPGRAMLRIEGLRVRGSRGTWAVQGVDLECRAGEILGVAGVEGNGQLELVEALRGLRRVQRGHITLKGRDLTNKSPREHNECGCCHIAEDRHQRGLMMSDSVRRNLMVGLHRHPRFSRGLLLKRSQINRHARRQVRRFDIRTPGIETPVRQLSGGNQQKVILARELSKDPELVIAVQPTRGLDIVAAEFVRQKLVEVRNRGKAVLLFSTDLDEIMGLSDRIAVMFSGRIMGVAPAHELSRKKIGLMMMGQRL